MPALGGSACNVREAVMRRRAAAKVHCSLKKAARELAACSLMVLDQKGG